MIFTDYKSPGDALKALGLQSRIHKFVDPLVHTPAPDLSARLDLVRELGYTHSESAVAQGLIFPVLLEVWAHYRDDLKIWSQPTFGTGQLRGLPDHVVTRIKFRGQLTFEAPYVVIVEAKKENFDEGWGQCLAAMVAARELNGHAELPVWGAVTTGHLWQFGTLEGSTFTQDAQLFALTELDRLCGALRYVFEQVKQYPLAPPNTAPSAA